MRVVVLLVLLIIGGMKIPGMGKGLKLLGMEMPFMLMRVQFPRVGMNIARVIMKKWG